MKQGIKEKEFEKSINVKIKIMEKMFTLFLCILKICHYIF